jgi:hypothetical protein
MTLNVCDCGATPPTTNARYREDQTKAKTKTKTTEKYEIRQQHQKNRTNEITRLLNKRKGPVAPS